MLYYARGNENDNITADGLKQGLYEALDKLGKRRKVLVVPPDITRFYSRAGELTRFAWQYYGDKLTDILPALGTHVPMTEPELERMFGDVPRNLFRTHDWRSGLVTLGEVPSAFIKKVSEGKLDYAWPAQVDRLLVEGDFDLILSAGQVVPHEVIGMANYNKNLFIGTGGSEGINKSHYLGAVYGMERLMGRADTPVRQVLNYATDHFARHLPIVYVQTVIAATDAGQIARGPFHRRRYRMLQPCRRPLAEGQLQDARPAAQESASSTSTRTSSRAPGWATRASTAPAWPWPTAAS